MNSQVSTERYLGSFGVSMKDAMSFIRTNHDNAQLIFEVCQAFKLTSDDLTEIVRQDFPLIASRDIANYFSVNGIESKDLDIPSVREIKQLMNYRYFDYENFYDFRGEVTSDQNYSGGYDLITVGDLNNDGSPEVVLGLMTWNDVWSTYPIEMQFSKKKVLIATSDPTTGKFVITDEYDDVIPMTYWTQKGLIDDFNLDGFNDLIIVGTGPDQGPPRGEPPHLLLGSVNGLVNASDQLPQKNMYTHQSLFEDFNNDGKTDFFIINQGIINSATVYQLTKALGTPYPHMNEAVLMLSNESGWTEKWVTNEYINNPNISNNFATALAMDFNSDGNLDLVLAGSNFGGNAGRIMFLRGDGKGGFQQDTSFYPTQAYGSDTVMIHMNAFDFDGDGSEELMLISSKHNGQAIPFGGAVMQVFKQNPVNRNWEDVSAKHVPVGDISNFEPTYGTRNRKLKDTSSIAVSETFFIDLDDDGDKDMILSTIEGIDEIQSGQVMPRLLINNEGVFMPTDLSELAMSGFGSLVPYNSAEGVSLIGATNVYGEPGINLFLGTF